MTYRDDPLDVQVARLRDRIAALEKRPALSDEVANERERCAREVDRYTAFLETGKSGDLDERTTLRSLHILARRIRNGSESDPGWIWIK